MTGLDRREFLCGTACLAGAGLPEAALASTVASPALEDWIGRDLLARLLDAKYRRPRTEADLDLLIRYMGVYFDADGGLDASASFRTNMAACLADRRPRLFPIRYFDDLHLFISLVRTGHPAFRGLAGVVGNAGAEDAEEFTVRFLVAPVELIRRERAAHAEVRRWGPYHSDDESQRMLRAAG